MAGNETLYTFVVRGSAFYARARQNVSSLPVYRSGAVVAPTVVSCTLVDRGGQLIATATTAITDDIATATFAAVDLPATLMMGPQYQERWLLTVDDIVTPIRRSVVLGRFEMHPPVAELDLTEGEYPDILTDLGEYGQTLQPFMDGAWQELCRKIERRGDFQDIFVQSSDVYDWYRHSVLERVFRALCKFQPNNERWSALWDHHKEQMVLELEGISFQSDRNRDGQADSQAREELQKAYHVNTPPRRRLRDPRW